MVRWKWGGPIWLSQFPVNHLTTFIWMGPEAMGFPDGK